MFIPFQESALRNHSNLCTKMPTVVLQEIGDNLPNNKEMIIQSVIITMFV